MSSACALKVERRLGHRALSTVKRLGLLDRRLKIARDERHVFLPLLREPRGEERNSLMKEVGAYEVVRRYFQPLPEKPRTLADVLKDELPPYLLASLPRSLDVIGAVAIVEIPPELEPYKSLIGDGILAIRPDVRTVLAKLSAVEGPYRLRAFETIAGEGISETLYREHGCVYKLDPTKVYFSPRLSFERDRVAGSVRDGETVLDMFAGVGPFAILIAKRRKASVVAIDANPHAIRYLRENVLLNRVADRVKVLKGDVREVVRGELVGAFDRVIMDLPAESMDYLDVACRALREGGGIAHLYAFAKEPDPIAKIRERALKAVEEAGRKVETVMKARTVRLYAPHEWEVVLDLKIR